MGQNMVRLLYLLYAIALLSSYSGLFGEIGCIAACAVLGFWALVFFSSDRPNSFLTGGTLAVLGGCIFSLTRPSKTSYQPSEPRRCLGNLKMISLALQNYHDVNGSFPPACVVNENGTPLYSWRVLLLPQLDQQALYNAFDLSKSWDSLENRKLLQHMPSGYACPSHFDRKENPTTTSYVAVVGPRTPWSYERTIRSSEITDGTANTVMVVESRTPIPWTAPRDLTREEVISLWKINDIDQFNGHRSEDQFQEKFHGWSVGFADGRVGSTGLGVDRKLATNVLTIDDGQSTDEDLFARFENPDVRTKWGNVLLLAICVVLTALPLPWVWWYKRQKTDDRLLESPPDTH